MLNSRHLAKILKNHCISTRRIASTRPTVAAFRRVQKTLYQLQRFIQKNAKPIEFNLLI